MVNRAIIGICLLWATTSASLAAGWTVEEAAHGSGTKWIAHTKNEQGDVLTLKRKIGRGTYDVFAELTLKADKFGTAMPHVQIDNGRDEDTRIIKIAGENLGNRWGYIDGNVAGWRVWTSNEKALRDGDDLTPWRQGSQVKIRYVTEKGKTKSAVFSLSGSSDAIEKVVTGPFQ